MGSTRCGSLDTYTEDVERIREQHPQLAADLTGLTGIGQIVDWLTAHGRPHIDMVGMDEYEYDFTIELSEVGWLVVGVT